MEFAIGGGRRGAGDPSAARRRNERDRVGHRDCPPGAPQRPFRNLAVLFACLVPLALSSCATTTLERRAHYRIESPHFVIVSSLKPEATLQLAEDLELFQGAMQAVMKRGLRATPAKTRVYALDDRWLNARFRQGDDPNHFVRDLHGDVLILRLGEGFRTDVSVGIRHAMAHAIIRQHTGFTLPLWYDEGIAEYASTIEIREDGVRIAALRNDLRALTKSESWISMAKVLAADDLEDWSNNARKVFGAESWTVIHYARTRQGKSPDPRFDNFLKAVFQGRPEEARPVRGALADELDRMLLAYANLKRFAALQVGLRGAWRAPAEDLETLSPSQALASLGEIALTLEKDKQAQRYFERALEADGDLAAAHAGMATTQSRLGDWPRAADHFDQALQAAPDDLRTRMEAGRQAINTALALDDPTEREALFDFALAQVAEVRKLDAYQAGIYLSRARVAFARDTDPFDYLETARRLAPGSLELALTTSKMAVETNRPLLARTLAVHVYSRAHDHALIKRARKLIKQADALREAS